MSTPTLGSSRGDSREKIESIAKKAKISTASSSPNPSNRHASDTEKLAEITSSLGFRSVQDHKKVDEFSDSLRSKSIVLYNIKKNKKRTRNISDMNKNTSHVLSMWPPHETVPTITSLLDLHRIWLSDYYLLSRQSSKSVAMMRSTLANLDLRGAKVVVLESQSRANAGQVGIVTAATQNQLHICIYDPSLETEDAHATNVNNSSGSGSVTKQNNRNKTDQIDNTDEDAADPAAAHSSSKHGYVSPKLAHGWEDRFENLVDLQGLALGSEVMRKYKGKLRVARVIKSQSICAVCIPRVPSSSSNSGGTCGSGSVYNNGDEESSAAGYVDQTEIDEADADGLFQLREDAEDLYIAPSSSVSSK